MISKVLSALMTLSVSCFWVGNFVSATTIDLTHTLSEETLVYPGKTPFSRVVCAFYEKGSRLDDIALNTGIGTHMDAPNHFCSGASGIDTVALSRCIGPGCMIDLSHKVQTNADYEITKDDVEKWEQFNGQIPVDSIVLFYTGWDRYWGSEQFCESDEKGVCHFPGVSKEAALLLVERRVGAVGIDSMGIDTGINSQYTAHKVLLGAQIPIVENLANLGNLPATGAIIYMLPMKIKDAPESPVRAMAIISP